ncbi:MAG: prolyl oligopeptidase family serine peptidase [Lysobacterales bacterium]|jgi:dipeptidyl aminopeptidase/acylaminoacyl peptidase
MRFPRVAAFTVLIFALFTTAAYAAPAATFTMEQVLHFSFPEGLTAAEHADAIAWVQNLDGVRNIWVARGPEFEPRQVTRYTRDDGEELTQLTFSPDGKSLVFVRGGDHDANWPAEGNLQPDPSMSTSRPAVTIWQVTRPGKPPRKLAEGDAPAISARGQLAFIRDDQVWTLTLGRKTRPEPLFFDRGKDSDLHWSPDGTRLVFVSDRGDHSFVGIYEAEDKPLVYLAPSTAVDRSPRWSPDGTRIAFVRRPGEGGQPEPFLLRTPQPWSIWVANVGEGTAHPVWQGPNTLAGSFPRVAGGANLHWAADDRLVFLAYLDDWPHLYSVPAAGGEPLLLTPGDFMVEHVSISRDRRSMIYDANTGDTPGDLDRRHLYRVAIDRAEPRALTSGESLDWTPASASQDGVAYITAGAQRPPEVAFMPSDGGASRPLMPDSVPDDFPVAQLVTPRSVTFQASDGMTVHGQLFEGSADSAAGSRPAIIFVHGGPPRQMLLGWHYMGYYSNAYAVNQYLAAHGFVVLSVNYRLGIGYGRAFHQPEHAGPAGASEYLDVLAGADYLKSLPSVDPSRIGIWGGSYGGYLTALALARNSGLFAAGVDLHGVHDWTQLADEFFGEPRTRYEQGDREEFIRVAWESSPTSSMDGWRSPVLLIQGDDDRNVPFHQTVDLVRRLQKRGLPYEELVIPNEIHGFLRHRSWLQADRATADFFARKLQRQ